ncbi:uncharacterized protein DS421_20g684650 [Arachis hypogaea]|nr:uncharacterized protein DS421_20g684650 [Arachis hypogaea]
MGWGWRMPSYGDGKCLPTLYSCLCSSSLSWENIAPFSFSAKSYFLWSLIPHLSNNFD